MSSIDKRPIFLVGATDSGKSLLMFGIPDTAWNELTNHHSFDFDLSAAGLPIYVTIFRAKDHSDAMSVVEQLARSQGIPIHDERRKDFSIKKEKV